MAELIGNGLNGAWINENLDVIKSAGVYSVMSTSSNKPSQIIDGVLVVLASEKHKNSAMQFIAGNGMLYYRYYWDFNGWSDWCQL